VRVQRGIDSLVSIGPVVLTLTVYSTLLDHLQDDWFKYDWLKHVVSGMGALCLGMASRLIAGRFRSSAVVSRPAVASTDGVLSIHAKLASCSAVIAADLRSVKHDGKVITGWSQYIGEEIPPTAIGTSYGLRIAMALDIRHPALDRFVLAQSLLSMQKDGGGWAASSQKDVGRPEVTAWVLAALCRCGLDQKTKAELIELLHQMAAGDPMVTRRTTVTTAVLAAMTEIQPASPLVRELANALVSGSSREEVDNKQLASWGENLSTGDRRDSPAHTARAVIALSRAASALQGDQALLDVREAGIDWLCRDSVSLEPAEEQIRRPVSAGNADTIFIGHFTASWVARALMCGDLSPERLQYVTDSVRRVIDSQKGGIWRWGNGEKPIWTSYQGVMTLRDYGLRGLKWPP